MSAFPVIWLARHGETAWSLSGQHTGRTDIALTARGEESARRLGERLRGLAIARVFTSPLRRAARTCALAGFADQAEVDPDLVEWDYGDYEGRTSAEIRAERPEWMLWRAGRAIDRVRRAGGDVLVFSSGHFLRVLASRWLALEPSAGRFFLLDTASLSALGYDRSFAQPVIRLWNDVAHGVE